MTGERHHLLRSILESPWDDLPRLVYADWLEEHGGEPERGEYIRIGCELAKLPELSVDYIVDPVAFEIHPQRREHFSFGIVGPISQNAMAVTADDERYTTGLVVAVRQGDMTVGPFIITDRVRRSAYVELHLTASSELAEGREWADRKRVEWLKARENELQRTTMYEFGFPIPQEVVLGWSRGFIQSITIPLSAFTEDFARRLFGSEPVTQVVLSDRQPYYSHAMYNGDHGEQFIWFDAQPPGAQSHAGVEIFAHLQGGHRRNPHAAEFPSREEALAALSAACVAWGRSLVGLPAIEAVGGTV